MATNEATDTGTSSSAHHTGSDIITNLANLLPTGTFLAFQVVAPLFTNNGACGLVEKILTAILIGTFSMIAFILSFTDSITTTSGKHYYGIVTCKGLYNPQFKALRFTNGSNFYKETTDRYIVSIFDFINGTLGVVVFCALGLLTPPVSTCYYPHLPITVVKAVPILVGIIGSMYFSFAPPPRRGVGFSVSGLVTEPADDTAPKVPDDTSGTTGTGNQPTVPAATAATRATSSQPKAETELVEGANSVRQMLLTTQQRAIHSTTPSPERFTSVV